MGLLSDNPMWEEMGARIMGLTSYGGADIGECLSTVAAVGDGDADRWHREWTETARSLDEQGTASAGRGDRVSAFDALMRAATYYRASYQPLFGSPVDDRLKAAFEAESEAFRRAAEVADRPIRAIEIPFEGGSLPAYVSLVDDSGRPRPTVLQVNGFDSNVHEMYFSHAEAANRRGYNWIGFDGPGQGRNLIRDGLAMRYDFETVVGPVLDHVIGIEEVDADRIVLIGWSLGGFLAPRAAAFHSDRLAALIADPGQWDQRDNIVHRLPITDDKKQAFPDIDPSELDPMEEWLRGPEAEPMTKWRVIGRGLWVNGTDSLFESLKRMCEFDLSSVASRITCPTLVTKSETDPISVAAGKLAEAVGGPSDLIEFNSREGAVGHCEAFSRRLYHQRVFDWLDATLAG